MILLVLCIVLYYSVVYSLAFSESTVLDPRHIAPPRVEVDEALTPPSIFASASSCPLPPLRYDDYDYDNDSLLLGYSFVLSITAPLSLPTPLFLPLPRATADLVGISPSAGRPEGPPLSHIPVLSRPLLALPPSRPPVALNCERWVHIKALMRPPTLKPAIITRLPLRRRSLRVAMVSIPLDKATRNVQCRECPVMMQGTMPGS